MRYNGNMLQQAAQIETDLILCDLSGLQNSCKNSPAQKVICYWDVFPQLVA